MPACRYLPDVAATSLFLALLLVSAAMPAAAAVPEPVRLAKGPLDYSPERHLVYLEDTAGSLQVEDVIGGMESLPWQALEGHPPPGRTTDVYWGFLSVENPGREKIGAVLRFLQHRARRVDLWILDGEMIVDHYSGGLTAPIGDDLFSNRLTMPFDTPPGKTYRLLLRVDVQEYLYFRHVDLVELEGYSLHVHGMALEMGLFIGVVLSMALLNLILYVALKEKSYLVFFFWILCMAQHLLTFFGEGTRYLLVAWPQLNPVISFFCHSAANVLTLVFAMLFLGTRESFPRLHRVFQLFIALQAVSFLAFWNRPLAEGMALTEMFAALAIPFFLAAGMLAWRGGRPYVRYYVIAQIILSTYAVSLWVAAIAFPEYIIDVANQMLNVTTSQMFLISMAQVDRLYLFKREKDEAERSSFTDDLTQIANRRAFDSTLEAAVSRCRREREVLSLLLIDIDYFKNYNDSLGHVEGDQALRRVATVIQSCLSRHYDTVARYGGEELAVILPGGDANVAQRVAASVHRALACEAIKHPQSPISEHITASIGIGTVWVEDGTTTAELVRFADQQLYDAKAQGRNCFRASLMAA